VVAPKPSLRLVEPAEEAPPGDLEDAFRRYSPYVAAIGLRVLGRRDEVDDLVQDVFLVAARGLERLRDARATRAWLATVTIRIARRKLRLRRLRRWLSLDEQLDYQALADDRASPEVRALLARVYRALDELAAEDRIAWTLRFVEGEELERVALMCGCSLATAKRRIARAQATIQQELADG
jgi:RNA polymerase sigma-70 factor (ECF subfamily)